MRTCRCSSIDATEHCGTLETFGRLRASCAALREILIPNCVWPEYERFCRADPDEARHQPVAYLAFKRRHLAQLTEPVHLFCLTDGVPHPLLTNQYKNDLIERWMFKRDTKQRYRDGRKYLGRVVELLFAARLHNDGWRIEALEALGGGADIVATDPDGQSVSFEIKYLAMHEDLFELDVKALSGDGVSEDPIAVYLPIDYLLLRIFEAAKQLASCRSRRIVVAILADYDTYFAIPLSEGWIDWQNPKFLRRESGLEDLLLKQYKSNPNLDHDMRNYISQIDQIWFCDMLNGFILRRRQVEKCR